MKIYIYNKDKHDAALKEIVLCCDQINELYNQKNVSIEHNVGLMQFLIKYKDEYIFKCPFCESKIIQYDVSE